MNKIWHVANTYTATMCHIGLNWKNEQEIHVKNFIKIFFFYGYKWIFVFKRTKCYVVHTYDQFNTCIDILLLYMLDGMLVVGLTYIWNFMLIYIIVVWSDLYLTICRDTTHLVE